MKIPFLRNFNPMMNLMFLFSLIFLGALLSEGVVYIFAKLLWKINLTTDTEKLANITDPSIQSLQRFTIIIQTLFMFLMPALVFKPFIELKGQDYLKTRAGVQLKPLGITLLFFFLCFPISNFLYYLNLQMDPEMISASAGQAIKEMEEQTSTSTLALLVTPDFSSYFINIISIALLTAIGEEFIFRGIMQRLFIKMFSSVHAGVIVSGVVFSLLHFSYNGLLPRIFMGVALGYLYVCTANIWYCVVFHFLNNAIPVTCYYLMAHDVDTNYLNMFGGMDFDRWVALVLLMGALVFAFTWLQRIIRTDFTEEMMDY